MHKKILSFRWLLGIVVVVMSVAMVGAACGNDDTGSGGTSGGGTSGGGTSGGGTSGGGTSGGGTGGGGTDVAPEDVPVRIIVAQHGACQGDGFWCQVDGGTNAAEAAFNVDVTITNPDNEGDDTRHAQLIDQAVASNPDAIVVTFRNPALTESITNAVASGIPVIVINSGNGPTADGINYTTFIGQDEYQGGFQSAIRLNNAFPNATRAVCVNHQPTNVSLDKRCNGFSDGYGTVNSSVNVVTIDTDGGDAAGSKATISADYAANGSTSDVYLTLGPTGANPFYSFLSDEGISGVVGHGTFDNSDEISQAITDDITLFAIDQQPFLQGWLGVSTAVRLVRYGITPAEEITSTGPGFLTKADLGFVADPDKRSRFIIAQHGACQGDGFWCVVDKGSEVIAKQLGVDVTVTNPDNEGDDTRHAQLIDQAVASNPDGIGLSYRNPALEQSITSAVASGVPVVVFNSGNGPIEDGINYLTFLGQDEYEGGFQSAGRLNAAFPNATRAVCVNHQPTNSSLDKRCNGFSDGYASVNSSVNVVTLDTDGGDAAGSKATISADYASGGSPTDVYLTLGPTGATPFYSFLNDEGIAGMVGHGTFDLSPEILDAVSAGTTLFGIDQQPFLQSYGTIEILTLLDRYNVKPAALKTLTGPGFVTSATVDLVKDLSAKGYR